MRWIAIVIACILFSLAQAYTYIDVFNQFSGTQGSDGIWWRSELAGDMTFNGVNTWADAGFPQAYFIKNGTTGTIYGFTGTFGGPQPYTNITWMSNVSQSAGFYVGFFINNTGSQAINVTVFHNNTAICTFNFSGGGGYGTSSCFVSNVAKSANITLGFRVLGSAIGSSFYLNDYRIGDTLQVIQFNVFDELTGVQKGFNLTVNGVTRFNNLNNPFNISQDFSGYPMLTAAFQNSTCLTGNIIPRYIANPQLGVNNVYLLCDGSSPTFVRFLALDQSQSPLANVTITISKNIGGASATITSFVTGVDGTGAAYLNALDSYSLVASKQGYTPYSEAFSAVSSQKIIILSNLNQTSTITSPLTGISYSITPSLLSVPNTTSQEFDFNVFTNGTSTVDWFAMDLYGNDGTHIFTYNNTNTLGGNITAIISTANYTRIFAYYNISRSEFGRFNQSQVYVVTITLNSSYFNQSAAGARVYLENNTQIGRLTRSLIALTVTGIGAAVIAPFNTYAAGGFALISIAYFSATPDTFVKSTGGGFLPLSGYAGQWALFALLAMFIIAITVIRWGV